MDVRDGNIIRFAKGSQRGIIKHLKKEVKAVKSGGSRTKHKRRWSWRGWGLKH